MTYWEYLERRPPEKPGGYTPASDLYAYGQRAHFVRLRDDGQVVVEFLNGDREVWPLAECRRLGA